MRLAQNDGSGIFVTVDGSRARSIAAGSSSTVMRAAMEWAVRPIPTSPTLSLLAPLTVGGKPMDALLTPDGADLYAVSKVNRNRSDDVSLIATETRHILTTLPVGAQPVHEVVSAEGAWVYVVKVAGGSVSVLDTATQSVLTEVPAGQSPRELVLGLEGTRAYVTLTEDDSVAVLDLQTPVPTLMGLVAVGHAPEGVAILNIQEGRTSPEEGLAIDIGAMDINEKRLQVYIELKELGQEILEQLKTWGVTIKIAKPIHKLVQARIPFDRIEQVSRFRFVKFIRLPDYGYANRQGSVGTEGVAVIRAGQANSLRCRL
jgi:YVTN family beta-propeller protein